MFRAIVLSLRRSRHPSYVVIRRITHRQDGVQGPTDRRSKSTPSRLRTAFHFPARQIPVYLAHHPGGRTVVASPVSGNVLGLSLLFVQKVLESG